MTTTTTTTLDLAPLYTKSLRPIPSDPPTPAGKRQRTSDRDRDRPALDRDRETSFTPTLFEHSFFTGDVGGSSGGDGNKERDHTDDDHHHHSLATPSPLSSSRKQRFPTQFRDRRQRFHSDASSNHHPNHHHSNNNVLMEPSSPSRVFSLSEQIVDSILHRNSSSSVYLSYLLRCCSLYLSYLACANVDGYSALIALAVGVGMAVVYVLVLGGVWLWNRCMWVVVVDGGGGASGAGAGAGGLFQRGVRKVVVQGRLVVGHWRSWIYQNLNILVTIMLIAGFASVGLGLCGFLVFKVGALLLFQAANNECIMNYYPFLDWRGSECTR